MGVGLYHVIELQKDWYWVVSTKDNAQRALVCGSVDLRAVHTCKWLQKYILVLLMFGDELSKAHEDVLTESFGFGYFSLDNTLLLSYALRRGGRIS